MKRKISGLRVLALLVLASCGGGGGGGGGGDEFDILPPSRLTTTITDDNIVLTWEEVSGAVEYRVYMASEDGVTKLGVLNEELPEFMYHPDLLVDFPHPPGLNPDTIYFYIMTAVNEAGEESAVSCEVAGRINAGGVEECED